MKKNSYQFKRSWTHLSRSCLNIPYRKVYFRLFFWKFGPINADKPEYGLRLKGWFRKTVISITWYDFSRGHAWCDLHLIDLTKIRCSRLIGIQNKPTLCERTKVNPQIIILFEVPYKCFWNTFLIQNKLCSFWGITNFNSKLRTIWTISYGPSIPYFKLWPDVGCRS